MRFRSKEPKLTITKSRITIKIPNVEHNASILGNMVHEIVDYANREHPEPEFTLRSGIHKGKIRLSKSRPPHKSYVANFQLENYV